MSWVGKLVSGIGKFSSFASKVGGVAQKFMNTGGTIGKIASGVSKAASTIGAVSSLAGGAIAKATPWIAAGTVAAKALYNTGIADKITGGKASRIVKTISNWISPNKGIQSTSINNAAVGHNTASAEFSKQMRGG